MRVPENKQQTVIVDDYYDKVYRGSWLRRSCGLLAGSAFGLGVGSAIGTVAAFIPYTLGLIGVSGAAVLAAPVGIPATIALFASTGAVMGAAAMTAVSSDSGAVAAGLAEKEKREKLEKQYGELAPGQSVSAKLQLKHTDDKLPQLFKWKVAIFTVPLIAAFGALLALNPITFGIGAAVFGFQAGSAAAVISSATVFGMFGACFACPVSVVTNKLSNFFQEMMTGKLIDKEPEPVALAKQPARQPELAPAVTVLAEPQKSEKSFASETTRFSLSGILEKTEEQTPPILRS